MLIVALTINLRNPHITTTNNILSSAWLGKQSRQHIYKMRFLKQKSLHWLSLARQRKKQRLELNTSLQLAWAGQKNVKLKKPHSSSPGLGGKTKHYLHKFQKKAKPHII